MTTILKEIFTKKLSLKSKFVFYFLLFGLIPALTITGFIITSANPNFTSESELTVISGNEENLQSVVIQIALQLNAYMEERYNGINNMKSNPVLTTNID